MNVTTNAPKMSLEEKLVQTLKEERLYALLGDEDALTELVKRAIHEALYQPTRVPKSYGGWDERDSIVVATAKEIAKKAADALVAKMVADMLADPAIKKATNEAISVAMPEAIRNGLILALQNFQTKTAMDAFSTVQEAVRNRTI